MLSENKHTYKAAGWVGAVEWVGGGGWGGGVVAPVSVNKYKCSVRSESNAVFFFIATITSKRNDYLVITFVGVLFVCNANNQNPYRAKAVCCFDKRMHRSG